ncbi:tumor protein p53-inducible protein 11-like isoform X1 [Montipora capricornis]|uniref:tumor protein p53-inducible protein 11-like isoform X1 n=2 Tax=Montipora capricornis TaxID=246305 RepID=UPI0035F1310F
MEENFTAGTQDTQELQQKYQQEQDDNQKDEEDNQEESNMGDPIRLSAPEVHRDFPVRRRSFDDAQSRLKCRKLLGIGGKEPSKVLQVLGSHESYFISIPRGYETWQLVVPVFLSVVSIMLLIFPGQCLRVLGDLSECSSLAGTLCCRLLASALLGIVGISWGITPTTISSIKRTLVLHSTYCGAATLFLGLSSFSLRTKGLIVLTSLHGIIALVSLFYFVAVRQLNKTHPRETKCEA